MCSSMCIKSVILGSPRVGKTSLLFSFTSNDFPVGYVPTTPVSADVLFNGNIINLQMWDTPGRQDYDRLRPLSYPQTDVFLLAFSLVSIPSFLHIVEKWNPELRHHVNDRPVILVGTKLDLRDDKQFFHENPGAVPISTAEGEELKTLIQAFAYIECSAKTQKNLKAVFDEAIKAVLESPKKITIAQEGCCSIL